MVASFVAALVAMKEQSTAIRVNLAFLAGERRTGGRDTGLRGDSVSAGVS